MRFAGVAGAGVAGAGVVGAISDISVTGSGTWPTFLSWNPDKVWYKSDFKNPPKYERVLYVVNKTNHNLLYKSAKHRNPFQVLFSSRIYPMKSPNSWAFEV